MTQYWYAVLLIKLRNIMAKLTLPTVKTGYNLNQINENFQTIATELQNKVLYRNNPTGEPNQWETQQDANSNRLINLPDAVSPSEPATLRQLNGISIGVQSVGIKRAQVSATAGQTVFATSTYVPGSNNLSVYINGVRQGASAYVESSTTSFTLTEGAELDDNVEYLINEYPELEGGISATAVSYGSENVSDVLDITDRVQTATTAQLEDDANPINTVRKKVGSSVFNTTTNRPVWSTGVLAGDVWVFSDGTTAHTPV